MKALHLIRSHRVEGTLSSAFFGRPTLTVARDLLGKVLVSRKQVSKSALHSSFDHPRAEVVAARIVEVEGYSGTDPASHCSKGPTPRCEVMFRKPGFAYVYFIYGMYEMLNFVTEPEGQPGAVLIRAVEPLSGLEWIEKRRKNIPRKNWTNGPGRLARAMGIRLAHNGESLQGPHLFVANDGYRPQRILSSPRVGIKKGVEKHWRYFIENHPDVSPVEQNQMGKRARME